MQLESVTLECTRVRLDTLTFKQTELLMVCSSGYDQLSVRHHLRGGRFSEHHGKQLRQSEVVSADDCRQNGHCQRQHTRGSRQLFDKRRRAVLFERSFFGLFSPSRNLDTELLGGSPDQLSCCAFPRSNVNADFSDR